MSHVANVLFAFSLCLNGIWLAKRIIHRAGDNSTLLVRATLLLFCLTIFCGLAVPVLHLHGDGFLVDEVATGIVFTAWIQCCFQLAELLPRPWGNAPRKRGLFR